MALPEELRSENLAAGESSLPPELRAVSDPEDKTFERPATAWQTLARAPLRAFLAVATTSAQDRGDMAQKVNDALGGYAGLGENAEVIVDPNGEAIFVKHGGKVTPLDPEWFGGGSRLAQIAESFADVTEDASRAAAPTFGSVVGFGTGTAVGGPIASVPGAMIGAGAGEAGRQEIERFATNAVLGRDPSTTPEERGYDVATNAAVEAIVPGAGRVLKAVGRGLNLVPPPRLAEATRTARAATDRLRTRASDSGIAESGAIGLGLGERGIPIWKSMTAQLRNLTAGVQESGETRDALIYQMVRNAADQTPAQEREFADVLRGQVTDSRSAGVEMIRAVTRARADLPLTRAREVAIDRSRQFIQRENARIRPMYEASARALRESGAELRYDESDVIGAFNDARGLDIITNTDGTTRTIRGDLPDGLEEMQRKISHRTAAGWPTLTMGGISITPEQQIMDMTSELGSMKAAYKSGTASERKAANKINDIRRELSGMLDNPVITGGDERMVAVATQLRRAARSEFAQFRDIMDRVHDAGLDVGDNAKEIFDAITRGGGSEHIEALQQVPELREAALEFYTTKAAGGPEQWADQVINTRNDVMLPLLGGDTAANRGALQNLKQQAELAKVHANTIERVLKSESDPVARTKETLFGPQTQVGRDIVDIVRSSPPGSPERARVGAAIVAWVFDQSRVERANAAGFLKQDRLTKALRKVRELGYEDMVPPETMQLLTDTSLYGSRAIGPGGLAQGLVQAETGARSRKEISEAMVGIGKDETGQDVSPLVGLPKAIFTTIYSLGGSEALGIVLTNPRFARATDAVMGAASGAGRLTALGDFWGTLARQSIVSDRMAGDRLSAEGRREANRPAPAGL